MALEDPATRKGGSCFVVTSRRTHRNTGCTDHCQPRTPRYSLKPGECKKTMPTIDACSDTPQAPTDGRYNLSNNATSNSFSWLIYATLLLQTRRTSTTLNRVSLRALHCVNVATAGDTISAPVTFPAKWPDMSVPRLTSTTFNLHVDPIGYPYCMPAPAIVCRRTRSVTDWSRVVPHTNTTSTRTYTHPSRDVRRVSGGGGGGGGAIPGDEGGSRLTCARSSRTHH